MKAQFDIKTVRMWPNLEPSERAQNTREYVLRQFWQTFVEDRLGLGGAVLHIHTHMHNQNPCSSYAMAVMDKSEGWEEEWMGSRIAPCMWIYTKTVICNGQLGVR